MRPLYLWSGAPFLRQLATPSFIYILRELTIPRRCCPRPHWPSDSPCASPQAKVRGKPGVHLQLVVDFPQGRQHLPIVMLKRVA